MTCFGDEVTVIFALVFVSLKWICVKYFQNRARSSRDKEHKQILYLRSLTSIVKLCATIISIQSTSMKVQISPNPELLIYFKTCCMLTNHC